MAFRFGGKYKEIILPEKKAIKCCHISLDSGQKVLNTRQNDPVNQNTISIIKIPVNFF
jgi:hypothetical protein